MQRPLRYIFPIFAVALAIAAALVSFYPIGESSQTRSATVLQPYTETSTWSSTYIKDEVSTETIFTTILRTEVTVISEEYTIIKAKKQVNIHVELHNLLPGDIIIVEAGSQVKVWIENTLGEFIEESDGGDLSYIIEEAGGYKVWFEGKDLEESREIFIGVSRPQSISTKTTEFYRTTRWTITYIEQQIRTETLASTLYTVKTVVEAAPLAQRILITIVLVAIAVSLGVASILLWRYEPPVEVSQYEYEEQDLDK